jgi:hypothetical protein
MATSNSHNFNVTAGDIITESLSLAGVYSPGESLPASESADALRTLNMMLKAQQFRSGIWLNRELSLFLQKDTVKYALGPTGDHCSSSAVKTELAADAASAATSITIDATTDFADTFDRDGIILSTTPSGAGAITLSGALVSSGIATLSGQRKILIYSTGNDSIRTFAVVGQDAAGVAVTETITGPNAGTVYSSSTYKTITSITISGAGVGSIEVGQVGDPIGIELDSGSVQWTYIASALSTTLTLVTALTGAAATDNHVYSYTIKSPRPIELIEARLHRSDDIETPLMLSGKHDYMLISNKTSEGPPNQLYYDKQLTNGYLYVWPEPDDVQDYLKFTARLPIQDLDSLTNDFEVGQEWYEPIAWNLAWRLVPKYGKPIDPAFKIVSEQMFEDALTSDSENTSTFIRMGDRRHA